MNKYTTDNPLKILSLGWGVQSWTLAAMAALGELPMPDYAVHADTTHEMEGTYAHARKYTPWLQEHGLQVVTVQADDKVVGTEEWEKPYGENTEGVLIPAYSVKLENLELGQVHRQCTTRWKITPLRRFARSIIQRPTSECVEMWMGISLDEWQRMRTAEVKYVKNVYPLVDQRLSRAHCVSWLEEHELDIPPKSACTFCPYHTKDHWQRMKRAGGADWDEAVHVDKVIRNRGKGDGEKFQLFIHRAGLPLEEAVRIPEDYDAVQLELPCDSGHCFV